MSNHSTSQTSRYLDEVFKLAAPAVDRILIVADEATKKQKAHLVHEFKESYTRKHYKHLIKDSQKLWAALDKVLTDSVTEQMQALLIRNATIRFWQPSDKPANPDEVLFTATYYLATIEIAEIYLGKEGTRAIADTKLARHPFHKVFHKKLKKLSATEEP